MDETTRDTEVDPDSLRVKGGARDAIFLVVVSGHAGVGKMFRLRDGEMILGRSTDVDILLEDDGVSRRHARVLVKNAQVEIEDLGSRNGTWLRGERITKQPLNDGDKVQVGATTILRLSYQDALDEALQRNLYESATLDAVTGLFNKKALLDALDRELRYALRHQEPLSVLMVDIDNFKNINDTYGHLAGDTVLAAVSRTMFDTLRGEDVVARYGGEEFAVLLRGTVPAQAMVAAERLRAAVAALKLEHKGELVKVTVSVGVTTTISTEEAPTVDLLLERADACLYRAKELGRNRVEGPATDPQRPW